MDTVVYIGRFLRYTLSRILILAVAAIFIVLSFFICMDYMNINVLVRDGFNKRAGTIIMGDDASVLVKVFTKNFIEKDTLLKSKVYDDYVIRGFNHKADIDFVIVFPWDQTVQVTMTERIPYIDGELPKELIPEGAKNYNTAPPEWQDGKYRLILVRDGDNWKIASMKLIENLPKTDQTTPTAGTTATDSATISPSSTESPAVTTTPPQSASPKPSAKKS